MKFRQSLVTITLLFCLGPLPLFGGESSVVGSTATDEVTETPFRFSAEFDIEQSYLGDGEVARGGRAVKDFDEYYSNLLFVYTPRLKYGVLRLGGQWERYSFGFPLGGQQLPNTLQAANGIIGFDTKFSDSILVRVEAQPGFYGTSFDQLDGDSFNVPVVLGGTYIYSPDLQLIFGLGLNIQGRYPVIPGGGVRWKVSPQWVLNLVLPTPRIEYQVTRNLTLFAGADLKANSFRVDDRFGESHGDPALNNAWLSYEEVRTGAGMEWKINSSLALTIEGGYAPYRQFDFYRTEVRYHNEQGAPYGSIHFHGEF
jgi:hypothetical protein